MQIERALRGCLFLNCNTLAKCRERGCTFPAPTPHEEKPVSFRMEFPLGCGRPQFWEAGCDFCEMLAHFEVSVFPDFPAAFQFALRRGWDIIETVRGPRYMCPVCCARQEE